MRVYVNEEEAIRAIKAAIKYASECNKMSIEDVNILFAEVEKRIVNYNKKYSDYLLPQKLYYHWTNLKMIKDMFSYFNFDSVEDINVKLLEDKTSIKGFIQFQKKEKISALSNM